MALVQVSQMQGRVPVTVFHLQDRVNLGNFAELEATAKEAFNNGCCPKTEGNISSWRVPRPKYTKCWKSPASRSIFKSMIRLRKPSSRFRKNFS